MAADNATTWSFSQSFTPQFQAMRAELESKIEGAKLNGSTGETVQELSVLLAKATKSLVGAAGSIPSYDQKLYENQLKELEQAIEFLRTTTTTKPKFSFKRKAQSTATPTAAKSSTSPPQSTTTTVKEDEPTASNNITLSSLTGMYLTRNSLPTHPQQTDLSLSDLSSCVVDLLPPSASDSDREHLNISALHVRDLTDCVLLLPSIGGSALLHNMTGCTLVLGCHQFRMHTSKNIDVFISIPSSPIIEHCNQVRFTKYPARLSSTPNIQEDFTVQDFSHIRATPSPHFSIMPDEVKKLKEEIILAERGQQSLHDLQNRV